MRPFLDCGKRSETPHFPWRFGEHVTTVNMSDPLVGHVLDDRYEIRRRLARGGMAVVYEAVDLRLNRVVAVKVMHEGLGDDADFARKFDREARAAARLSNPYVVSVFDQGSDRGRPFIVMEFVDGRTLRHLLTNEAPLSPNRALELYEPIIQALASAHENGLIHRDVKPENVLISTSGKVKVADFGLAKAVTGQTVTGTKGLLIGTVSYIAPELVTQGRADPRSDVYSAGILLYELLTGRKPHTGDTPIQVAYAHVHNRVPAPSAAAPSRGSVPAYLDALVMTATDRDPKRRPQDARILLDHVRRARRALTAGITDDPELVSAMRAPTLDAPPPASDPIKRAKSLRFTPSTPVTPVSPAFENTLDGIPYYDDPAPAPVPASARVIAQRARQLRRRRRSLLAFLLVLVMTFGVGYGSWYLTQGRFTTAPALANLTEIEARSASEKADVSVTFEGEYSPEVAKGTVTRTIPAQGERILRGGQVHAFLSLGPQLYSVPPLTGLTQAQAVAALSAAGFAQGTITSEYSEKAPAGSVIRCSPPVGMQLPKLTKVDLVVSSGPRPVRVPSLVGHSLATAKAIASRTGLTITVAARQNSASAADNVIAQSPASGTLRSGSAISVTVSSGPAMVTVPNVKALPVARATTILQSQGFKVTVVHLIKSNELGLVSYARPALGGQAAKGATITLYVV